MIKIESPYSQNFKKRYWEWFEKEFDVGDSTKLSDVFIRGKYEMKEDFNLKDVIIDLKTFFKLSLIMKPIDKTSLNNKYDFVDEYEKFSSRDNESESTKMNAVKLYKEIGIKICPYCNINNISFYKDIWGKKRGHLDHFYCKKEYPYLALALYNLIPTCSICNSNFKGDKRTSINSHIHPYFEGFDDDAKFILTFKNIKKSSDKSIFSKENSLISFKYKNRQIKIRNNNKLFHLVYDKNEGIQGVYQDEIEYAVELRNKFIRYTPQRIKEIKNIIGGLLTEEKITEDLFGKMLSNDELINNSKGKLSKDLYDTYYMKNL